MLLGMAEDEYALAMQEATAVRKGFDFVFRGERYQVKANRPSGRKGSKVSLVAKAANYDWDKLVWILYDRSYRLGEAWLWSVEDYRTRFEGVGRVGPQDMRGGRKLEIVSLRPQ